MIYGAKIIIYIIRCIGKDGKKDNKIAQTIAQNIRDETSFD